MNEMILSGNLEQLMRIHGNLSVTDLARATKIPQPTLHHILSGSTKRPRMKSLEALASFFCVSIKQLIGEEQLPNSVPERIKEGLNLKTIPIIHWELLKNWPLPNANGIHFKEILLNREISNNSFALILQDSLMEPAFPQNALLIFDFGKEPVDRDYVIVHATRTDDVLFNRFFTDNNERYIKQDLENGHASLIKLDTKFDRIIGKLIEVRVQY